MSRTGDEVVKWGDSFTKKTLLALELTGSVASTSHLALPSIYCPSYAGAPRNPPPPVSLAESLRLIGRRGRSVDLRPGSGCAAPRPVCAGWRWGCVPMERLDPHCHMSTGHGLHHPAEASAQVTAKRVGGDDCGIRSVCEWNNTTKKRCIKHSCQRVHGTLEMTQLRALQKPCFSSNVLLSVLCNRRRTAKLSSSDTAVWSADTDHFLCLCHRGLLCTGKQRDAAPTAWAIRPLEHADVTQALCTVVVLPRSQVVI